MNKLQWSIDMKKIERGNRVVLANSETGNWIKISKECFLILAEAVEKKLSYEQVIQSFSLEEDRKYMLTLIQKLYELGIWECGNMAEQRLQQVYFLLTHRCNLNCIHCSMNASQSNEMEWMNTEKIIAALHNVIKLDPEQIVLSGGEPLIRKDFWEILNFLSANYNGEITLMTNGTLINEENVREIIQKVSSIDISIDGVDEITCSKIRGRGVFEKVIKSVGLIKKYNFNKISLSMVFGNNNYYMLPDFYEMNRKLGTKPIPRAFSPIGRGKDSREYFDKVSQEKLEEFNQESMQETLKACNCKACRKEICIDFKGDIYPCALLVKDKYKLGNIFNGDDMKLLFNEESLKAIQGYQEFEKLYPDKIERCKECDLNIFCWSCLHFADIYIDSDMFEQRCQAKKEALEKLIWDME